MKRPLRQKITQHAVPVHHLRQRAEATLRGQTKTSVAVADTQRLVHELQVHQVELEMQNTELRQVRDELEVALANYTDLYDFAPAGYFTLAADGTIEQANLFGANLVGIERSRLVGKAFSRLLAEGERAAFAAFLKQVFASQLKRSLDVALHTAQQPFKVVRLRAQRSLVGRECRLVVLDITELKREEDKLRVSEVRYRRLFETAHDGVLLLDPATRKITDANPFMTRLLGYPHAQLVGKELFEIGLLKDEAASREMFERLKREREVRYEDLPLETKGGRQTEVEVVANLYQEGGHAVIQCNIRDITARKHTEHELAEKARLLDLSHDAIIVRDMVGHVRYWNHGAEELYGWSRNEAMGKLSHVLLKTKFPIPLPEMTKELHRTDRWIGELVHTNRTGRRITVLARKTLDRDRAGQPVAVLENLTDITERKVAEENLRRIAVLAASNEKLAAEIIRRQAVETALKKSELHERQLRELAQGMQQELRQLSQEILHTQEEERKRISRELHDVIAQTLTGINLRLAALKINAGQSRATFERNLAHAQKIISQSVDVVHQFARGLRPAVLDDLGLIPALHGFLKDFTAQHGVRTQLTACAEVEQMDIARRTVLFRVAQEALTNVARHAHASRVAVSLEAVQGGICLKIKDDGRAFAVPRGGPATGSKRLGLLGMQERLEMIGGSFAIESAPGEGTCVIAQLPLEKVRRRAGAAPGRKKIVLKIPEAIIGKNHRKPAAPPAKAKIGRKV